jgi:AcrR family transcriptional regulator
MEKIKKRQTGDVRRSQIKTAVKEIIFYEGLQKLTTKKIARKVGISEGTVFKHYTSKKAIIEDVLDEVNRDLVGPLQKIAYKKAPAAVRFEKYICFHLDYLAQNKGITILLFTEASYQKDELLKVQLDETFHMIENNFSHIIGDGLAEGIWDKNVSVDNLSKLYMGIPLAMNIELLLKEKDMNVLKYCRDMQKLILRILEKR